MADYSNIIYELVVIFAGATVFATLFLYLKQPVMLAYIVFGMIAGPWGLGVIKHAEHIEQLSHLGIILLLFLIGLNLQPERLLKLFSKTALFTLITSALFMLLTAAMAKLFGYGMRESLIIGAAMMFSSTIVGLKLIPTTTLHHRHRGEMMTSVLLLQDVIAIVLILMLSSGAEENVQLTALFLLVKLIVMVLVSFFSVRYVVNALFQRFDIIAEYVFLLSLGWGLLGAGVANYIGLSYEMGAFIAGVTFASSPVAQVVAENLKPLRDFFLILFFFAIGANINLLMAGRVLLDASIIAVALVLLKPLIFHYGFQWIGEPEHTSLELGSRLGQASEFSILVALTALSGGFISEQGSYLIQTVVVMTFILSTYWVVYKYPTPISSRATHRKD
ncbi:MAG: cation:proton antiporter [Gammaproteobacteria bacterium]|nr:cation:proton antiporter [Gammaproteobacteria bacterium]MCK5262404.1 cation:proton antiporter [Gammaproteobacteria bacterium]